MKSYTKLEAEVVMLRANNALLVKENERMRAETTHAVAEVVSGYSGDPDSRGSKKVKVYALAELILGTKLYSLTNKPGIGTKDTT